MNFDMVFKITDEGAWSEARSSGAYHGSQDDVRDGFIHLSAAPQLPETARRHFRGRESLLLIAFDASSLGASLRWEPSRGGELFPHLYAPLPTALARWSRRLPLDPDGVPILPEDLALC